MTKPMMSFGGECESPLNPSHHLSLSPHSAITLMALHYNSSVLHIVRHAETQRHTHAHTHIHNHTQVHVLSPSPHSATTLMALQVQFIRTHTPSKKCTATYTHMLALQYVQLQSGNARNFTHSRVICGEDLSRH